MQFIFADFNISEKKKIRKNYLTKESMFEVYKKLKGNVINCNNKNLNFIKKYKLLTLSKLKKIVKALNF